MSSSKNLEYQKTSFLSKSNSAFIEQMYLKFINKDSDLPESWKKYFLDIGEEVEIIAKEINGPSWNPIKNKIDINEIQTNFENEQNNITKENIENKINKKELSEENRRSIRAVSLIRSYRQRGHLIANLDPLELRKIEYLDELHPRKLWI
jgi:2-oxoglutarate dehydrogenase complex, dehydrogenase (E1) component, and related enzymes